MAALGQPEPLPANARYKAISQVLPKKLHLVNTFLYCLDSREPNGTANPAAPTVSAVMVSGNL